jgi:DNA-binding NtrC family response regulator
MGAISNTKQYETNTKNNSISNSNNSVEVVVIEDNRLTNTILSRALESTIKTIENLKNITIAFSSYANGADFLNYLENKDFNDSKLIVFSDFHLEDNMDGGEILKNVKQKKSDAFVIIMSDSSNEQIWLEAIKNGAYCFLPKSNKIPVVCSELLFQMIV